MKLKCLGASALLLLILLAPDFGLAQPLRNFRNRNGVRLQGLSGPRGRLELASSDSWYHDGSSRVSWSAVCDSDFFTDDDAEVMCKMLNYTYGRKFFHPSIAYRTYNTFDRFIGRVACSEREFPPPPPVRKPPSPRPPSLRPPLPAPSPLNGSNGTLARSPSPPLSPPPHNKPPVHSPPPVPIYRPLPATPSPPSGPIPPPPPPPPPPPETPPPLPPPPSSDPPPAVYGPVAASPLPSSSSPSSHAAHPARRRRLHHSGRNSEGAALADGEASELVGATAGHHHHHRNHHNHHQRPHHAHHRLRQLMAQQQQQHQQQSGRARARSLVTPVFASLAAPRSSPYICEIRPGACLDGGPFVGIECSHLPMEPAPPPPPRPPMPPPSPPAVSSFIRMYGPYGPYSKVVGAVEPNLIDDDAGLGSFYGRFELLVEVNGSTVWAPVCTPDNELGSYWIYTVATIACQQLYDWPQPFDGGIGLVFAQPSFTPFNIPSEASGPYDFDPSAFNAWVSVEGEGDPYGPRKTKLQDLELKITSEPCSTGAMLAVYCNVSGERRRT